MRRILVTLFVLPLVIVTGCALALRPYNAPSTQKLSLQTQKPTEYAIRVADAESFPVPGDGRVSFEVPSLQRGCDAYLFGALKVRDGSPENIRAIHVIKSGKVVRKLSLAEVGKLPVDAEGYHVLVLK
jgi:hypothetical protein